MSTLPGHALFLFNNAFVIDQSAHFARRLLDDAQKNETQRIMIAYQESLNRDPDPEELYRAIELLEETTRETG